MYMQVCVRLPNALVNQRPEEIQSRLLLQQQRQLAKMGRTGPRNGCKSTLVGPGSSTLHEESKVTD